MPFARKSNSNGSVLPSDTRNIFIGRTGELLFFVQNILKSEEPTHNIISIWGQGGVGKSTLLSRFIDEAHSADFQGYYLTAKVDELQTTPAGLMEKFANQLHIQGAFEKALNQYKEALRKLQVERETLQHTLVQRLPTLASATLEGVPFAGPLLREGAKLTKEQLNNGSRDMVKQLSQFIEANLAGHLQELFVAANDLLETLAQDSSFPADILASIYLKRGWSYAFFKKYQEAIADFNHALALNPNDATAYNNRGWIYWRLYQYQKAISDFNHALKLSPNLPGAYNGRGWAYAKLKDYHTAISDFDRSLELVPNNMSAYTGRGWAYGKLKDYQKTSSNFERILAIEPKNASDYFQHGLAYLWQKHIEQARVHFIRGWELYPTNVNYGWMGIWSEMCQERPSQTIVEQLETIASVDPQCYEARICRGVALWLQGNADRSLKELEEAIQLDQDEWDSYFWKGMVYASMGLDEEAMAEIEKALEAALPPVLLIPLRWFKLDRPDFYQKYVMPLMIRYDLA